MNRKAGKNKAAVWKWQLRVRGSAVFQQSHEAERDKNGAHTYENIQQMTGKDPKEKGVKK